jgi:hypothetical protein
MHCGLQPQPGDDGAAKQLQAMQWNQATNLGCTGYQGHEFATRSVDYVKFKRSYINNAA